MAYDPKLWTDIKERYWRRESPGEISKSLKGKPSKKAIENKIKAEKWDQQKKEKIVEHEEKTSQKFSLFLEEQHQLYILIKDRFQNSLNNIDELGRPMPFCSVRDIISLNKDWRELFGIIRQEEKPQKDIDREVNRRQKAIKDEELLEIYSEIEELEEKAEERFQELGIE